MSFSRVNAFSWAVSDELTSAQMNALDIDHANALDKSAAGDTLVGTVNVGAGTIAVNSTGSITVGGSTGSINANASGGIIQASASGALIKTVSGGRLQHADNDYPTFGPGHTGESRTLHVSVYDTIAYDSNTTTKAQLDAGTPSGISDVPLTTLAWGSFSKTPSLLHGNFPLTNSGSNSFLMYVCPISKVVHQGATLSTVTANVAAFVVSTSAYPASGDQPLLTVYRVNLATGAITTLGNSAQLAVFGGGTVNTSYPTTLTYTPSQNNVIDRTSYSYWILFAQCCGANSGNLPYQYGTFDLAFTSISDLRFP